MKTQITTKVHKGHPLLLLDRDGVILKHKKPYILAKKDIEFVTGSLEALKYLATLGIPIAVITNQSPIGRGLIPSGFIDDTNRFIQDSLLLTNEQIKFYYCPHVSEDLCSCRKPKVGMLIQACSDFKMKPDQSWIIGDHDSDMQAGLNFLTKKRIHLLSGRQNIPSHYATDVFDNLLSFVKKYFEK